MIHVVADVDVLAEKFRAEAKRYSEEKADIMKEAKKLEEQAKASDAKSEVSMHVHHRWAQATTLIQIAIALAAITLLTRNAQLKYFSYAVAAVSIVLGALAALHV